MSRQLSQQEIDAIFQASSGAQPQARADPFDFRRPDRIAKSQIRAIQLLHDTFVRNLASSLSVYLRCYLTINLVSVEQISYIEFVQGLPSPTYLVSLGLRPYDGNGVLELGPSLVFPTLELLLGGTGKASLAPKRGLTEIEQKLLDRLVRIILQDLREAWKGVTEMEFTAEAIETEPQLVRVLAPNEPVVAVGVEVLIGETAGMMNIALPSIVIKMMRHKFDEQSTVRKSGTDLQQARRLQQLQAAQIQLEACLEGLSISVSDLLGLAEGSIVEFERSVRSPIELVANRKRLYLGQMVNTGRKRGFLIEQVRRLVDQSKTGETALSAAPGT